MGFQGEGGDQARMFGWFLPLAVRAGLITWEQRLDATVAEVERWPLCYPYYEMRRNTDLWVKSQVTAVYI